MNLASAEALAILAEEAAEVIQSVTKIQRFGLVINPWTEKHNRDTLETELGDLLAAIALAYKHGLVDPKFIVAHANAKLNAFRVNDGRLRHANADQLRVASLNIFPDPEHPV